MTSIIYFAPAEEFLPLNSVVVYQHTESNEVVVRDCKHTLSPVEE